MQTDFTGYILAGGKSSRMKTDKASLRFGAATFPERAVMAVEIAGALQVKVVFNDAQKNFTGKLPERVSYVFDRYKNRGALGGMHAAFSDCPSEWAIILAVDLPLVSSAAIRRLIESAVESKNFAAVVPVQTDKRPQPLCAVYRVRDCLPKLDNMLKETESAAVKDFLKLIAARFVDSSELPIEENEDIFFNVNEPDEYQSLIRSIF